MMAEPNSTYQAFARKWRPQRFEEVVGVARPTVADDGTVEYLAARNEKLYRVRHLPRAG